MASHTHVATPGSGGKVHALDNDLYRLCRPKKSSKGFGPGNLHVTDRAVTCQNCLKIMGSVR